MPHNMERFTQRARRILSLAQEEAERRKHNYIGPEHLLMGLMREEGGVAGRVLRDLGLEQRRVEELFEELTQGKAFTPVSTLDLSPETKQALELAVDEARRMGHHYIGTEHLLLGLTRQSDSIAIDILKRFGVSPEEIRRQTRRVLQESPVVQQSPQSSQPTSPPAQGGSGLLARSYALSSLTSVLQTTILKMLEMIEAQKLTIEQASELLTSLQPGLFLLPGQQTELVALFTKVPENRRLRLIVTDKETGASQLEIDIPLSRVLSGMDTVVRGVTTNQLGLLWLDENDPHSKLEIRLYDEKPSASAGGGDA